MLTFILYYIISSIIVYAMWYGYGFIVRGMAAEEWKERHNGYWTSWYLYVASLLLALIFAEQIGGI